MKVQKLRNYSETEPFESRYYVDDKGVELLVLKEEEIIAIVEKNKK